MYHMEDNQVAIGLIVDLGYSNPHLSPFDEFQRFKHHKLIKPVLEGGSRVAYGARAVIKGGLNALPKLTMPGGLLVGDDAGFLNNLKQKGTHTAMKSGMLAADAVYDAVKAGSTGGEELTAYPDAFKNSWLYEELHTARNTTSWLHKFGLFIGSGLTWVDQLFGGKLPLTLRDDHADHDALTLASKAEVIDYPKPDGKISFDKLSSVFLTNTNHEEDQPCHLQLADPGLPISSNLPLYDEPLHLLTPDNDWLKDDSTVNWVEAAELPLCLLSPSMRERQMIDAAFSSVERKPEPQLESNSIFQLAFHVMRGDLATIVPKRFNELPGTRSKLLVNPTITQKLGLVWASGNPILPMTRALIEILTEAMADQVFD